ncbi:MAG: outer membrane beta-barrel protein [Saprospiraceae bacterium]
MNLSTKNVITLIAVLIIAFQVKAQTTIFFGPTAGVQLTGFKSTGDYSDAFFFSDPVVLVNSNNQIFTRLFFLGQDVEPGLLPGINGGVTAGIQINRFAFQSGLKFYQQGGKFSSTEFTYYEPLGWSNAAQDFIWDAKDMGTVTIKERQNMLQIPAIARYRVLGEESGLTISIGAIFNLGIGKATREMDFEGKIVGISETPEADKFTYGKDLDDRYNKFQPALNVGIGYEMRLSDQGRLHFNFSYQSDFGASTNDTYKQTFKTSDGVPETFYYTGEQKNYGFGLSISYEHHLDFSIGSKY